MPPIPFPEFVLRQLIGAPSDSQWDCPFCDHHRFYARKPDAKGKVRFACGTCDWRGDEFDLLRDMGEPWPARRDRIEQLREQYQREHSTKSDQPMNSSPRGEGSTRAMDADEHRDLEEALVTLWDEISKTQAVADLGESQRVWLELSSDAAMQFLEAIVSICRRHRVTPSGLLNHWKEFRRHSDLMLRAHALECDDPSCGEACLRARGIL